MQAIRKAIFPVAGFGTRFLPATKASPKEMLPIVDKPLIQYAVEEAVAAGITEIIFITGRGKRSIEDHFDKAYELECELEAKGAQKLLAKIKNVLPKKVSCVYVRQSKQLGLGHAVLCARHLIDNEPFAVILAGDLIDSRESVTAQLVDMYQRCRSSLIAVQHISRAETVEHGIVEGSIAGIRLHRIRSVIEKPYPKHALSTLGIVGRYIFTPAIFDCLLELNRENEIQLTNGIQILLKHQSVLAYEFDGTRFDCGSKLGYLKASIAYGLKHEEIGQSLELHLRRLYEPLRRRKRVKANGANLPRTHLSL